MFTPVPAKNYLKRNYLKYPETQLFCYAFKTRPTVIMSIAILIIQVYIIIYKIIIILSTVIIIITQDINTQKIHTQPIHCTCTVIH